jgi:hypothetical protein
MARVAHTCSVTRRIRNSLCNAKAAHDGVFDAVGAFTHQRCLLEGTHLLLLRKPTDARGIGERDR